MNKILSKKLSALGIAKLRGFFEWLSIHPIMAEVDGDEAKEEGSSGSHKMIIFAYHHKVLDEVQAFICENGVQFVRIDCTITGVERKSAIQSFQSSKEVKIALIGIRAGGSGLDLTSADNVVFLELPTRPGEIQQAEDRAHRYGQKRPVNIYIFCAKDTSDDLHWQRLNMSLLRVSSTINGKNGAIQEIEVESVSYLGTTSKTSEKNKELTPEPTEYDDESAEKIMKTHSTCVDQDSQPVGASSDLHVMVDKGCGEQYKSNAISSWREKHCFAVESMFPKTRLTDNGCINEVEFGVNSSVLSATLRFEVSKYTGRIHMYSCIPGTDSRPRPLFENFRPEEIECRSLEADVKKVTNQSIKDNPLYNETLVEFINEWKKLRPIEKRKLISKPLQLPLSCELCYLNESMNHINGGLLRGGSRRRKTPRDEISYLLPSNATLRKVNLCVGHDQKEQIYTQGWSDMDEPLCKLCQNSCKNNNAKSPQFFEDLFCSLDCFEEYRSRTSSRFLREGLFQIERGICKICQLDCHLLVKHLRVLSLEKRLLYIMKVAPNIAKREKLLNKLVHDPLEGNAWHADHIIPVYKGGGECKLENMRTLCVACHADVTTAQCAERRTARNNAKRRIKDIMNGLKDFHKSCQNDNALENCDLEFQQNKMEHDLLIEIPGSAYSGADLDKTKERNQEQELLGTCRTEFICSDNAEAPEVIVDDKRSQEPENLCDPPESPYIDSNEPSEPLKVEKWIEEPGKLSISAQLTILREMKH